MPFNLMDVIIVGAAVMAALGGYRIGFVARVTSWIGLALGLLLAARFLPRIVDRFHFGDSSSRLLLAAGVLIGGAFIGQALGLILGGQLHRVLPVGPARSVDRGVGAAIGLVGVMVSLWLLLPSIAGVPGVVAREARTSDIATFIDRTFPRPPDAMQALSRLVGKDNFPRVFDRLLAAPDVGPAPVDSGLADAVQARVIGSTVRVEGQACDRVQDGSGFAVATDLIVTNAHVVAGEKKTYVFRPDGTRLAAVPVLFDSDRDLALLRVAGLDEPALTIGTARAGDKGAVFGHPGGVQQIVVAPALIDQEVSARGRDLYDQKSTTRQVFILASDLHPGDSGGPLVDTKGDVVGVAFAIAPDKPGTSYALTSAELGAALEAPRAGQVSTGPCLSE